MKYSISCASVRFYGCHLLSRTRSVGNINLSQQNANPNPRIDPDDVIDVLSKDVE